MNEQQKIAKYRCQLKRKLRKLGINIPWDTPTQTLEQLTNLIERQQK